MASQIDQIPYPPGRPPGRLPSLVDDQPEETWRLHFDQDPSHPKRYPTGRSRFDAPASEYLVTYVNDDKYACFGEVYGDSAQIGPNQLARKLSRMTCQRPLRLIPLDDGTALAAFGLDLRLSTSVEYGRTMQWSLALHDWYPDADGIRYVGRHAATKLNRCLFLDRCGTVIEFHPVGRLRDLRDTVIRAADAWSLAPRLFDQDVTAWP